MASEFSLWEQVDVYTIVDKVVPLSPDLTFLPITHWADQPRPYDVVIGMEAGRLFWPRRAPLQILWIQVADHLGATAEDDDVVDYTAFLTGWHEWYVRKSEPWLRPEHCIQIPNMHEHVKPDWTHRRKPHQMIYMSSPDRGLHHALRILDGVRERIPDATLKVLYGAQQFARLARWSMFRIGEQMLDVVEEHEGADFVGSRSHAECMDLLRDSALLLYPCDAEASSETFCTVVLEACATRTPTAISNAGCLEVQWQDVAFLLRRPINVEAWVALTCRLLEDVDMARKYVEQQGIVADLYDSTAVAKRTHDLVCNLLGAENRAAVIEQWRETLVG